MGIGKRLLDSTADLAAAVAAKQAFGDGDVAAKQASAPRTAPGQMMAVRGEVLALQSELGVLRERLATFDGSMPTLTLDPKKIRASQWANRHESSFSTPAFARLKTSIEESGGNVQPILVHAVQEEAFDYELIFGHRRHRACLELGCPVLSVVWAKPMPDLDLFLSMERENREREDLSPYEQGLAYQAALERGLFPSARRLAESIGISHTWVGKVLLVAQLPQAILEVFAKPAEIQPKHAEALNAALAADKRQVLRRAEKLRQSGQALSTPQAMARLLGDETAAPQTVRIKEGGQTLASIKRDSKGRAIITIEAAHVDTELLQRLPETLRQMLTTKVAT